MKQGWQKAALCRRSSMTAGWRHRRHFVWGRRPPAPPEITGRISIQVSSSTRSSRVRRVRSLITSTVSGSMASSVRRSFTVRPPVTSTSRSGFRSRTFTLEGYRTHHGRLCDGPAPGGIRWRDERFGEGSARRKGPDAQGHRYRVLAPTSADHVHRHDVSGLAVQDELAEVVGSLNGPPAERHDHVAGLDPGLVRRTLRSQGQHERPMVHSEIELSGHPRVDRLRGHPEVGQRYLRMADGVTDQRLYGVGDGDGESNVLGLLVAGRIDPDHDSLTGFNLLPCYQASGDFPTSSLNVREVRSVIPNP